ncbi:unnamed protein product [Brassica oleracea var. botrytis]
MSQSLINSHFSVSRSRYVGQSNQDTERPEKCSCINVYVHSWCYSCCC